MTNTKRISGALAAACIALLAGCASAPADSGFADIETVARERLGKDVKWNRSESDADEARTAARKLLAQPLSADGAVQVALLMNPGLQASYSELGIARSDLARAGRLPNPRYSVLRTKYGNEVSKVEESIGIDVMSILTLPLRREMEGRRFERVKQQVAGEVLRVAADTRRAWIQALAAAQSAKYLEQVKASAEAGAELGQRMVQAGNWSRLAQMREHAFYADATAQLARGREAAVVARERLTRMLGLEGADVSYTLPDRLPDLPGALREIADIEALAMQQRADIAAARREAEATAEALGLTRTTRLVNALEIGRARTKEGPNPFSYGYEIRVELPLFDWGSSRVARAEAIYMQSVNRVAETAVNARSEVREAWSGYRSAFDLARHYRDEVVPLRKKISEENLLRYNGMLTSVFELLADAREQVTSVNAYIDALRNYWLADADLQIALTGRSGNFIGAAALTSTTAPVAAAAGH